MRQTMTSHALAALVAGLLVLPASVLAMPDFRSIPKLEEMKDRPEAPDFKLMSPSGKPISLRDFRGKVVFLNMWASWCGPCRTEMPGMDRLYHEFKGKGFEILAVNVKDKREDALRFLKELKISYPVALDPQGEVGLLYGAWGMPTTYLIDRKGAVLARLWGPADWYSPAARNLIKALVEQK
jgi:DsbE subfamily thiol:disulfide oxidoreductase